MREGEGRREGREEGKGKGGKKWKVVVRLPPHVETICYNVFCFSFHSCSPFPFPLPLSLSFPLPPPLPLSFPLSLLPYPSPSLPPSLHHSYAKIHIPIIASVSEHQPTTWTSFFFDLHILVCVFPAGVWFVMKYLTDERVFGE